MADPALLHNHLTTILNALTSIDRRLGRIEATLKIPNFNNVNPAISGPPSSSSPAINPTTGGVQAGQIVTAPLPPPPPPPPLAHPPAATALHHQQHPRPAVLIHNNNSHNNQPTNLLTPTAIPSTTFIPLEPPPNGYTISSRASMQEELDQWTLPRGYSMRIAGAKVSGKRKVRWVCFRGGEARQHRAPVDDSVLLKAKAEGRRKPTTDRASKKCGCLFKFEVIETAKDSDVWVLHYPNEEHKVHNHGPSDTTTDPRARKLPAYMSAEVDQWLREGWLVSKIQEELRTRGFTNVLNTDLYNRKRLLKKEGGEGNVGG
ncbi:sodium channel protein 60E [Chaetomidium leptoderma]|uniref:Sodium channel protein 60E n=1 Tax=Chaetomidium leptoderma TaxID=669021 RepID=A0AAN6VGT4_9PEZI|nr:sodium channel protein 60E [Chaetomidium leptoderma]